MVLIASNCIIYVPKAAVSWINTSMKFNIKFSQEKGKFLRSQSQIKFLPHTKTEEEEDKDETKQSKTQLNNFMNSWNSFSHSTIGFTHT